MFWAQSTTKLISGLISGSGGNDDYNNNNDDDDDDDDDGGDDDDCNNNDDDCDGNEGNNGDHDTILRTLDLKQLSEAKRERRKNKITPHGVLPKLARGV